MSRTGMPSVIAQISSMPASAASRIASAAPEAGTNTTDAFAPVSRTASRTVFQTGSPHASVPPRPGVTPPTTFVPNSSDRFVWS